MEAATTTTTTTTAAKKRAVWKPNEDLLLAREVAEVVPYRAGYGEVMPAWGRVAVALASTGAFGARALTERSCYSRFEKLVEAHRRAPARGPDETTELTNTLDALLADYDAFVEEEARAKEQGSKRVKQETESPSSETRATSVASKDVSAAAGGGFERIRDAVATLLDEVLARYNDTVAAAQARAMEQREKLFERKLAALREERRLDREARAEDARLAREQQAQQRRQEREEREQELAAEREERREFIRELLQEKRNK
ncbi:hypothetical protein PybrP1_008507 [[Pythium] brassicae (nom. inval.)]|nr:hypothetical protein PybrP1_008507 [[Pythium] brassicae (nom. inval.)]